MLSNLFRRSARHNQRATEEQNFPNMCKKEKKKKTLMLTVLPALAFKGS